jgi:hypothetical protein
VIRANVSELTRQSEQAKELAVVSGRPALREGSNLRASQSKAKCLVLTEGRMRSEPFTRVHQWLEAYRLDSLAVVQALFRL